MGILILVVAVIALLLVVVGALAGADPEGRGGSWLFVCWGVAVVLVVLDLGLIVRWVLS